MKTSTSQFELMVTFMEQHGDLSKPQNTSRGRVMAHLRWDELMSALNSDGSGYTRTNEKWKKVWSDYKNNTKRKAARIHKAARGGGPAVHSKLSDLELRVLALVGVETATGLNIEEAGVPQEGHVELNAEEIPQTTPVSTPASTKQVVCETSTEQLWKVPGPSWVYPSPPRPTTHHAISPPLLHVAEEMIQNTEQLTPTRPAHDAVPPPQPAPARPVTPHRARRRLQRSSRRLDRPAEQAADNFLRSDKEWRNFRMQQHRETMAMQTEQNRLKELEIAELSRRKELETQELSRRKEVDLQIHMEWSAVALAAIQVLDKLANKL